ncbi:MAG TPA: cation-transporting P-type ATPase [Cyclobacteriaceae bacterium]|jgi:Ca2+-transporting ATPase|nr:cation-transporting P-type ATPase [Cyclobacteriaceae bacterium]
MKNPHAISFTEVFLNLKSDPQQGITSIEAESRLKKFGANILEEKKSVSPIAIFIEQFKSPFVLLLAIASGLSIYFGEDLDAIAIGAVLIINAIIGFVMEYQAGQSMEALKKLTIVSAKVVRDGKVQEIPSYNLVPGDVLYVEPGDIISSDVRLFTLSQLEANESSLTGESIPVRKQVDPIAEASPLAERTNMLYKGTHISKGNGYAIVTATGMRTELGKIATMVQTADAADTPLEKKIGEFSKKLIWFTVAIVVLIFLTGILNGDPILGMLQTSIALAVAAIPEGLPIVATLALAQGMLRMARQNVIVKKLAAVETLGGTTVICTDKTGTLTENRIEVNHISTNTDELIFEPDGLVQEMNIQKGESFLETSNFEMIQLVAGLCNTAEISIRDNELIEIGDPLETGLLKFVRAGAKDIFSMRKEFPKVKEEPFNSETRIMATCHQEEKSYLTCAKGAVEELLSKCTQTLEDRSIVFLDRLNNDLYMKRADEMAASGLRVIGMAYKKSDSLPELLCDDLIFIGLVGMIDPARKEVPAAIHECRSAGVKVVMVTGDHPSTAKNIGMKLGLVDAHTDSVLHGNEMGEYESLDENKRKVWLTTNIFARVNPKQKLDLVKLLQENNQVVAMTGDGINDAPALKKADIGIAMGLRGTQVAQDVADMVLKDDSFASIVVAIKQGRVIFENIRKFIIYLLSCNVSELILIGFTSIFNIHYALFPLQILFINIITDVLPALALGVTEGSDDIMTRKPRNSREPIIDNTHWRVLIVYSIVISVTSIGAVYTVHYGENWNHELCNNILFITLIFSQLFHVFNITTDSKSFFKTDVAKNKYVWYAILTCTVLTVASFFIEPVANALRLDHLSVIDWIVIIGFSMLATFINWMLKKAKLFV